MKEAEIEATYTRFVSNGEYNDLRSMGYTRRGTRKEYHFAHLCMYQIFTLFWSPNFTNVRTKDMYTRYMYVSRSLSAPAHA